MLAAHSPAHWQPTLLAGMVESDAALLLIVSVLSGYLHGTLVILRQVTARH